MIVKFILIVGHKTLRRMEMTWVDAFIASSILYNVFRCVDVLSTKFCLSKLDLEMYEVNPIVVFVSKKVGFDKAMLITGVLFTFLIGFADAFWVYPIIGIPLLWLLFGLFHLLAAMNNVQVYFQIRIFGAREIEESISRITDMLKPLPLFQKIIFLIKINIFNFFLTIYGIVALILFSFLFASIANIQFRTTVPILLVVTPPVMILDLIMFFPTTIFGSLLISMRRLKINKKRPILNEENRKAVLLPIELVETMLNEARERNADYIQVSIPNEE